MPASILSKEITEQPVSSANLSWLIPGTLRRCFSHPPNVMPTAPVAPASTCPIGHAVSRCLNANCNAFSPGIFLYRFSIAKSAAIPAIITAVMRPKRHLKHTDLFLVRFWTEEPGSRSESTEAVPVWRGRVQRVIDGESREFNDWEALVGTLGAMLSTPFPPPKDDGAAGAIQLEPHAGSDAKGESG